MITKRDISIIHVQLDVHYNAREMGTDVIGKIVCSFDEPICSFGMTVAFKKGNPLLQRFNILMRYYLEGGFVERVRSEEQHRASLVGRGRLVQAAGDEFFAFSISHIMPAFAVLLVGNFFSSAVFIAELIVNRRYKRRRKTEFLL